MKKLITMILLALFISNTCRAGCDWKQIKPMPNGDYDYTPALHLCVGQLVEDSKVKDQQIQDLTKAIQLKDLALGASDSRVALWEKTSDQEMNRLNTIESDEKRNDFLYFGLGVLGAVAIGFATAKLIGR